MSARYGWTDAQIRELVRLAKSGKVLNKDIATKLGKKPASIGFKLRKLGIKNTAYLGTIGHGNKKYSDELRKKVIAFYKTHSATESARKFKLTHGQIIGLLETSRRMGLLGKAFKDKRNKNQWTAKDYRFLLAHSGLMPRDWIAKRLGRGSELGIKDRLEKLNISSKSLNGLTISQFRDAFGRDPGFCLKTKAGPRRKLKCKDKSASHYKIVPWVWLENEIKEKRISTVKPMRTLVYSMARFQRWIHGDNALEKMVKICRKKLELE